MGFGCFPPGCCGVGRPYHPYFLFLGACRVVVASMLGAATRVEAAAEIWALQTKEEVTFERLSPEESSGHGVCHAIERKIRIKTAIGA